MELFIPTALHIGKLHAARSPCIEAKGDACSSLMYDAAAGDRQGEIVRDPLRASSRETISRASGEN
jgi:hypothetical protein